MKDTYNEKSDNPVFNDYEESITFDDDDPDFKPNDDSDFKCNNSHECDKKSKYIEIKLSKFIINI